MAEPKRRYLVPSYIHYNLCHRAIQYYTIMSGNNENLFEAVNRVQLPRLLQNYIVYGMSLFDETDDSEEFES